MKIGIVTFWQANNCGTQLQTLALQTKLKELYNEDEVFVVACKDKQHEKAQKIFRFYFRKNLYKLFWYYFYQFFWMPVRAAYNKKFNAFRAEYLLLGSENQNDYDMLFYGSDQIWNPTISEECLRQIFLGGAVGGGATHQELICGIGRRAA